MVLPIGQIWFYQEVKYGSSYDSGAGLGGLGGARPPILAHI